MSQTLEVKDEAYKRAQAKGADTSTIALCAKIRKLAKLGRLKLDEEAHRSSQNTRLFEYIEFCGKEPLAFVKEYLSNLQPYMIIRNQSQEPDERFLCVLDNQYSVSLYIKFSTVQHEEMVVSFHENHIRGVAKRNRIENSNYVVPIFAENILSHTENTDNYVVRTLIQRGMLTLPIRLSAEKCADVFLVEKSAIDLALLGECNAYLQDLYTSGLDLDFSNIEIFSALQQISFTSYGRDTFSTLSLLVDNLFVQSDTMSRSAADFALTTYAQSLVLTEEQRQSLCDLLEERYRISADRKMPLVLERIKSNLQLSVDAIMLSE